MKGRTPPRAWGPPEGPSGDAALPLPPVAPQQAAATRCWLLALGLAAPPADRLTERPSEGLLACPLRNGTLLGTLAALLEPKAAEEARLKALLFSHPTVAKKMCCPVLTEFVSFFFVDACFCACSRLRKYCEED